MLTCLLLLTMDAEDPYTYSCLSQMPQLRSEGGYLTVQLGNGGAMMQP